MTAEQMKRELDYGAMAHIAEKLLRTGLISEREYRQLCTKYERKHRPIIGGYIALKKPGMT
jgi:hypothetical protein